MNSISPRQGPFEEKPVKKDKKKEASRNRRGLVALLFIIGAIIFLGWKTLHGQELPGPDETAATKPASYCFYTKKEIAELPPAGQELVRTLCEAELANARKQLPIGIAAKNKAEVTITYRDAHGKAMEGSKGWAKLQIRLREEERKEKVGIARAENPTCGWGCTSGYYGGGVYDSGGWVNSGVTGSRIVCSPGWQGHCWEQ